MNADEVLLAALDKKTPAERAAYLDGACGSDARLRGVVEGLLKAHQDAGDFLEEPLFESTPTCDLPRSPEKPGTQIGPYKLLQQIGEGGMGAVFMAEQTQPVQRKVALKILKPGMDSRQVIGRFEAERQALALMDHPNIAKVIDAGTTSGIAGDKEIGRQGDKGLSTGTSLPVSPSPCFPVSLSPEGRPYFVMELVKGVPITKYCDDHHLTPKQRLELFVPVCQAAQHAHQKGIIHRDLKPSNVLVAEYDDKPVAKIIDFGVAKATGPKLTERTLFTEFGQIVGTLEYMSPEQAKLNALDIDTRSDIYALGVLLYELLTGTTPFEKKRLHSAALDEVLRIIREEEPPKPSTRLSTTEELPSIAANRGLEPKKLSGLIRGELDWIVMKCLEKDRNRRYETANGLAHDIERYLHDKPVYACPPSAWYRFRKLVRRKKTAFAIAACVIMALAGIAGAIGWALRDKEAREEGIERARLAREEALDQAMETTLNETGPLMEQGKWPEALARVDRAEKLLAAAGRTERPLRLFELRRDLSLAERLEQIYRESKPTRKTMVSASGGPGTELTFQTEQDTSEEDIFWGRAQDAHFAGEFRDIGIDLDALEPAEAAAQLGRTNIGPALVQALDQWAALRMRARGGDDPFWKKLVEIARQADSDDWRNRFREALLLQDRQALEKLADAVPIRAVPPATVYLLAPALKGLGAVDKAMAVLREALRHHPDDFWLNDAGGWFNKEAQPPRYGEALRYYQAALAVRPQSAGAHVDVADMLSRTGALEESLAEYCKAIELDPKHALAFSLRGHVYNKLQQYDQALTDFSKSIELDTKNAVYWHNRGWTYIWKLHECDKALADFSRAIELDPKHAWALSDRGHAYNGLHQYDKALADFSKSIELDPKNPVTWYGRGWTYINLHQYDDAIADYSKGSERDSKNGVAWNDLSWFLSTCPDPKFWDGMEAVGLAKKAVGFAKKAIELAPDAGNFWNTLGAAHYRAGNCKEAVAALVKSMELRNGGDSFDWFFLAMANWQMGEKETARKFFDQAVQWMDKNPQHHEQLHRFRAEVAKLMKIEEKTTSK
jgi:serine/threonine protein kinase/Tfp pilus assembly protein PilF